MRTDTRVRRGLLILGLLTGSYCSLAQASFKAGFYTNKTGSITHEYAYSMNGNDTSRLSLLDSTQIFVSVDSTVIMVVNTPLYETHQHKSVKYLNLKKLIIKTEEYQDENLQAMQEWRYDDKNRKVYHLEDNKTNGNVFKQVYEYTTDKKTGEPVVLETAYFNGRIEFYTRIYYDKNNQKIKEIRLNDNNKDVVHVESYFYGENGKLKERSVYFPEWKVTKKFQEKSGNLDPKCSKLFPLGIADKFSIPGRVGYIKKVLGKNQVALNTRDCTEFEFKFTNLTNCELFVSTTNANNGRKVVLRYKEKY